MPTLLITGANRGIGLALCQLTAAQGWTIHACCRQLKKAKELKELQAQYPENIQCHVLDVKSHKSLEALQESIGSTPIDVLINNAGVHALAASKFGDSADDAWQEAVGVNLLAPMKMMELFVDNIATSTMKTIANISSKMGSIDDNGSGGAYAYRATKAALNAVSVSAAHDLKHRDIIVMILHPGWVRTDMGGPHGEISVSESAIQLLDMITNADMNKSGRFLDIDGSEIAW